MPNLSTVATTSFPDAAKVALKPLPTFFPRHFDRFAGAAPTKRATTTPSSAPAVSPERAKSTNTGPSNDTPANVGAAAAPSSTGTEMVAPDAAAFANSPAPANDAPTSELPPAAFIPWDLERWANA